MNALKAAIEQGLRKSRHEEAPIPVIRESDLFHITHMVHEEVEALVAARFARLRHQCDVWDGLSKGDTATTRRIREILDD